MKKLFLLLVAGIMACGAAAQYPRNSLREAFKDKFLIGAALSVRNVNSPDIGLQRLIRNQFSSIVAENCMKGEALQPEEGTFDFADADKLVELGLRNGQAVIGHCLIWHDQAPYWFYTDSLGHPVTPEVLAARIRAHIQTVVGHFRGRVRGWDVVNEAILDDGSFRPSPLYQILGEDFFEIAFKAAHEADPDAELYYNDYSMDRPGKRAAVVRLVGRLKAKGCRVDAIGMQSHLSLDTPLDEYEKSIVAFGQTGCKVMATELDLSVLPWPGGNNGAAISTRFDYDALLNPYADGLPKDVRQRQRDFYDRLFAIYLRHADVMERVTFWGVSDADSWKNSWPVPGRTDYPLAFDRQLRPKPFVKDIIKMVKD